MMGTEVDATNAYNSRSQVEERKLIFFSGLVGEECPSDICSKGFSPV